MPQAANSNAVRSIGAPQGAVGDDCTDISLWSQENGGDFLQSQSISTNPSPLALGERYEFAAGALVINQPVGTDDTEAMARRAVRGRIAGGVWVQYHAGAAGANGTDNVIQLGRVNIAQSNFTVT